MSDETIRMLRAPEVSGFPKEYVRITYMCRHNAEHNDDRMLGSIRLFTFPGAPRTIYAQPSISGHYPVDADSPDKFVFACVTCGRNEQLNVDRAFDALDTLVEPNRRVRTDVRDVK